MTRKTLYLLSQHFYPSQAATAQLVTDISQYLSTTMSVVVITETDIDVNDELPINVVRLSSPRTLNTSVVHKSYSGIIFIVRAFIYLFQLPNAHARHLLIVSNPPFAGVIGILLKHLRGLSYSFLFQDLFPRSAVLAGILPPRGLITSFLTQIMRIVIHNSSATILLSSAMKHRAITEYSNSRKYHIIPNWAVERALPTPRSQNILALKWNISDQFVILYSGNFGRLHDITTILESARICSDHPHILFLFVGGGAQLKTIEQYVSYYKLSNISVQPYVSRELLPLSLDLADLAVVSLKPGAHDTVSPSKIYGVMASEKPVLLISSYNTSISDEISSSESGLCVETGDSVTLAYHIKHLSTNPSVISRLKASSSSLYNKKYGREKSLLKYKTLLNNLF